MAKYDEVWYISVHPRTREPFSSYRYSKRFEAIKLLAEHFGCWITSGLRYGSGGSLHDKASGGLAFDVSAGGNTPDAVAKERQFCQFIKDNPRLREMFQEVVAHDLGSGYHGHAAFKAGVTSPVLTVKSVISPKPRYEFVVKTLKKGQVVNEQTFGKAKEAAEAVREKLRKGKTTRSSRREKK